MNMIQKRAKILAVDDEDFNLDILTHYLHEAGFNPIAAIDGEDGLKKLDENPDIELIVLDRMMPKLNGMQFISRMKENKKYRDIPVIMQTAAANKEQVMEGIKAGVFYYLTKPYEGEMLVSIVRAALKDASVRKEMLESLHKSYQAVGLMEQASFRFRTLEEAKNLTYLIANCFPDPDVSVYALGEMMVNAIEHGNLGITYDEKTKLVLNGKWEQEIQRRLELPENEDKYAVLTYKAGADKIVVSIKDRGQGFDWKKYSELKPERATDPNGRGIATAKLMASSHIEYVGKGNEVIFTVDINKKNK